MEVKIITGVPVYTMDEKNTVVEAVAIVGDKIDFVGRFEDAKSRYSYGEIIKLDKGAVLPGFIDPHIHLFNFSMMFKDIDLSGITDREDLIDKIKDSIGKKKESEWIIGGGLEPDILNYITRFDIDRAVPFHPVILYTRDLHTVLVNTRTLEISGIDQSQRDPVGGRIERDGKGNITGVLRERAIELVSKSMEKPDLKSSVRALKMGMDKLLSLGITTIGEATADVSVPVNRYLMSLWRAKNLPIRVSVMFGESELEFIERMRIVSDFGDEFLRIGGLKIILDGSLSSLTGYMRKPYLTTNSNGVLFYSEDELYRILRRAYTSYLWSAIHATGDKANEIAIRVYERLIKDRSIPKLIKRIEHAQTLSEDDVKGFASMNIIAVVNPSHIPLDRGVAVKYLGKDSKNMYRLRSLLKSGCQIAIASDAPVVFPDPFYSIYCAVERKGYDDGPELRFYPKERITLEDALKAHTVNASIACGMNDITGSIEVGKKADLIHISKDIVRDGSDALKNVRVLKTFVNGELVFGN